MRTFYRRLLSTVLILCGIAILNFFLFYLSPGDPTNLYFGPKVDRANLEALRHEMGLEKPWTTQLIHWLGRVVRGDLGYSWAKHRPVRDIIVEAVPATLQLTLLALLLNMAVGCTVGVVSGIYGERWPGRCLDTLSLAWYATPGFLIALLGIYVFCLKLRWLPASGMESLLAFDMGFWEKIGDRLTHLILPVTVLGLAGAAATSRYVQEHMRRILKQDYIRMAFAKGLSKKRIILVHAFKNALIPVVTLLGLYFPFLLGSALIVEVIFAWPGMGRVAYEAIFAKDTPVIMIVNLIAGLMVIIGNTVSDMLYRWIDPRIRIE